MHAFQLLPFYPMTPGEELGVTGTIRRNNNVLHLLFRVSGNPALLRIAGRAAEPKRCDNLWQTTCFECFLRRRGRSSYHELNISPSGCWNLYQFKDYRAAMRENLAVATVSSEIFMEDSAFAVCCSLELDSMAQPVDELDIGVCSVLEHRDGKKSYWALSHPGQQPDFHHPGGFVLQL